MHLLALPILDTHITYHTKHKEGPLIYYISPQEPLPSSAIQGGHRKVELLNLHILFPSLVLSIHSNIQSLPNFKFLLTLQFLAMLRFNHEIQLTIFQFLFLPQVFGR